MKDKLVGMRTIADLKMLIDKTDVVQLSSGIIGKKTKSGGTVLYYPTGERVTNQNYRRQYAGGQEKR